MPSPNELESDELVIEEANEVQAGKKSKPKPKPPKYEVKKWFGYTRIQLEDSWYIVVGNLSGDAWIVTPETEGEYGTKLGVLKHNLAVITKEQMQKALNN